MLATPPPDAVAPVPYVSAASCIQAALLPPEFNVPVLAAVPPSPSRVFAVPPSSAPATPKRPSPPAAEAEILMAAYQHHLSQSPARNVNHSATNGSVFTPSRPEPAGVEDAFDPLQASRHMRGLPKNAEEFWKAMEPYFVFPSPKDADYLARVAFPDGDAVGDEWEDERAGIKANSLSTGVNSASSAARAARRGPSRSSATDSRVQRQLLLDGLRNEDQAREMKRSLEELLVQARLTVEPPIALDVVAPVSITDPLLPITPAPNGIVKLEGDIAPSPSLSADSLPLLTPPQPPVTLSSTLLDAYQRYQDSRLVCSALESVLPIQSRQCTDEQLTTIMQAVWKWMAHEEQAKFHACILPSDALASVATAASSFYASVPRATLTSTTAAASVAIVAASPSPAAPSVSPTQTMKDRPDADGDDDDGELDVENLTLLEAEDMLEALEFKNQSTACLLQNRLCQYMIGAHNLRYPAILSSVVDEAAASDLRTLITYAQSGVLMNPRNNRPFSFSISGTFSRRSADKRRMDLVVSKDEKQTIDKWLIHVDKQEYWKQRKEDDAAGPPERGGGGKGRGKGIADRVDSTYVRGDEPKPKPAVVNTATTALAVIADEPMPGDDADIVCCVCGDGDCEGDNQIIFCDRCDIAVHQDCYGTAVVPSGEWYCAPCSMHISRGCIKQTATSPQFKCAVCWQKGGAMRRLLIEKKNYKKTLQVLNSGEGKPPAQLTFAHLACALWIGELFLLDAESMTPIAGLHNINPQRFKLKCSLCKVPGGACVQCSEKKCCVAYHMQCALEHGAQLDTVNDTSQVSGSSYVVWCEKHRNQPRINTVLKAVGAAAGQVQGGILQCQVCCYNVEAVPIDGVANDMLKCTSCDLTVHNWCYGAVGARSNQPATRATVELITDNGDTPMTDASATVLPTPNGDATVSDTTPTPTVRKFLCRVCEWRTSSPIAGGDSSTVSCALCLATQGALKKTEDGRWVCLPCTYFTAELFFGDTTALEPIKGVTDAWKTRSKMSCTICDRQSGCPVQCFNAKCATAYHVSCAFAQGWEFKKNPNARHANDNPFISYCGAHSRVSSGGALSITANPAFATATFSSFSLPDEFEDEVTVISSKKSKSANGSGGGSGRKRKQRSGKHSDSESDDSVMLISDSDDGDSEAYRSRGTKSRSSGADVAKWKMSGVGQMVFESKKKKSDRSSSGGRASATPAAPAAAGGGKYTKIVFLLNNVPVLIHLGEKNSTGQHVFHNAPSAARVNKHAQRKLKASASAQQVTIKMTNSEDETAEEEATVKPGGGASPVASRMPRSASSSAGVVDTPGSDSDSDFDAAASDEELFCRCRQPWSTTSATMIGCDQCDGWFHLVCLGITGQAAIDATKPEHWTCPDCVEARG